jgi:glycosyltransferase involved in cell wall biosynthesis
VKVAILWQRFLPYHVARLLAVKRALERAGALLVPVEVASQDAAYGFPRTGLAELGSVVRVLGETSYHAHGAAEIHERVLACLERAAPDAVFCPATAFPEGMAGVRYRCQTGGRVVIMDDAWGTTDRRGSLTRAAKRCIHRNVDAAFVPAPSHAGYYRGLGFPDERIFFGVDAVDNRYFAEQAARARERAGELRASLGLPPLHFLFVGRLLPRKGVGTLLQAYAAYRAAAADPWGLVLVGSGPDERRLRALAAPIEGVTFVGPRYGGRLCEHYACAGALVVPSESDPWALVVNEGAAASLPLIVSGGCGAAATLVEEGANGWTFTPGAAPALAALLARMTELSDARRGEMGERSREIVSGWSTDRFAAGVLEALRVERRPSGGPIADALTRLWKGRVSVN